MEALPWILAVFFFGLWMMAVNDWDNARGRPIKLKKLPKGTTLKLVELPENVRYVTYTTRVGKSETQLVEFPNPVIWTIGQELIIDNKSKDLRRLEPVPAVMKT